MWDACTPPPKSHTRTTPLHSAASTRAYREEQHNGEHLQQAQSSTTLKAPMYLLQYSMREGQQLYLFVLAALNRDTFFGALLSWSLCNDGSELERSRIPNPS